MATHACKIDVALTGAVANTYATVAGFKLASTAGHHATLRRLVVGGGGGVPENLQTSIRIKRSNNTADGTSTSVNVNTIGALKRGGSASNVSAIGKTYTVEPTTAENGTLGGGEFNSQRGPLVLEWPKGEGPEWGESQTLLIQGASSEANAVGLGVELEWDE